MDPFNKNPRSKIKFDQHEALVKELDLRMGLHHKDSFWNSPQAKLKARWLDLKPGHKAMVLNSAALKVTKK